LAQEQTRLLHTAPHACCAAGGAIVVLQLFAQLQG